MASGVPTLSLPRPTLTLLTDMGLADDVLWVYRALGGRQHRPRIAPGGWDFATTDMAVELDEQRHFNRYRRQTLDAPRYGSLEAFPRELYASLCDVRETECLNSARHGGY